MDCELNPIEPTCSPVMLQVPSKGLLKESPMACEESDIMDDSTQHKEGSVSPNKMRKSKRKCLPEKNKGLQFVKSPINTSLSDVIKLQTDSETIKSPFSLSDTSSKSQSTTVIISTPDDVLLQPVAMDTTSTILPNATENVKMKVETRPRRQKSGEQKKVWFQ